MMVISKMPTPSQIAYAIPSGIFCIAFDSAHSKNQDYTTANKVITSFDEIRFDGIKTCL